MYKNKRNILLKFLFLLILCCFATSLNYGQNNIKSKRFLDSIYNKYISLRIPDSGLRGQTRISIPDTGSFNYEDVKCGFRLSGLIHANISSFSPEQQAAIKAQDTRPVLQASVLSPSGHFRIHYDNTGINTPLFDPGLSVSENVRQIALALDSAYSFEVNYLGFPPPPSDNMAGGDNAYDIYIYDLGDVYGNTVFENEFAPGKWTSYMEMDNDFREALYYTHGFVAARATAAHEFHHSIQIGNYNFRDSDDPAQSDVFFHELTSTSMEEFVFPNANDYWGYLSGYFSSPDKTFPYHSGYDMAIWNIFLVDRYGFGIIKRQWELYVDNRAISAINLSISEASNGAASFKTELNEFGIWTFYTNYRAVPGQYFQDAPNYPVIRPQASLNFTPGSFPLTITSQPLSNYFITIRVTSQQGIVDTITTKITDGDLARALDNPSSTLVSTYSLFADSVSGSQRLVNNYYYSFSSPRNVFLETSFFNNKIVHGDVVEYTEADYPYPNPYNYKNSPYNNRVNFPVSYNELKNADIYIYSIGMNLVYNGNRNIFADPQTNKYVVSWDGMDSKGNKLPTGVYIYVVYSNGNIKKGKIVIQNE